MQREKCVFMNFPDGQIAIYSAEFRDRVHRYKKWRIQEGNRSERLGGEPIYYAVTNDKQPKRKVIFLHKLLYPDIPLIEHIDGDGLNNMPDNIRAAVSRKNADDPMQCIQWCENINTYYVRVKKPGGNRECKRFSARNYNGSLEEALKEAQKFRDELRKNFEME